MILVKFGCTICVFPNFENLNVEVRISRIVSEDPFNFEITRVDCIFEAIFFLKFKSNRCCL